MRAILVVVSCLAALPVYAKGGPGQPYRPVPAGFTQVGTIQAKIPGLDGGVVSTRKTTKGLSVNLAFQSNPYAPILNGAHEVKVVIGPKDWKPGSPTIVRTIKPTYGASAVRAHFSMHELQQKLGTASGLAMYGELHATIGTTFPINRDDKPFSNYVVP
jgi:hypothetical protein